MKNIYFLRILVLFDEKVKEKMVKLWVLGFRGRGMWVS